MQTPKIKNLVLSLTGQCNFACRYCYAAEHDKNIMNVETALAAIDLAVSSLPANEKFIIQFSGGEPLLNFKVLHAAVSYVQKNKLPAVLQIQTNGSLLTDQIAQYLFKNKVAIGISLDGKPNVNDKLRLTKDGKGATNLILHGLEVLRRNNISCGLTCVVTADNVDELSGIVDMAYFLGNVRKIGFDLLRGQGRGSGLVPPTEAQMLKSMEEVYARVEQLSQLAGYKISISQAERAKLLCTESCRQFGHCYAMNGEAAFVDASGKIYACSSLIGNEDFYLGNVQDGLDNTLVKKVSDKIFQSMSFCRECTDFKLCGGGCFARWYGSGAKVAYKSECAMKRISIKMIGESEK